MSVLAEMTLGELIDQYRPLIEDESGGVRRSWEETFSYATRHFSRKTPLQAFDLDVLADRLTASGMQHRFVEGYISRWRTLLAWAREL